MGCLGHKATEELDGQRWKERAFQAPAAVAGSRKGLWGWQGWRSQVAGKRPSGRGSRAY